jgi:hypothetical protein
MVGIEAQAATLAFERPGLFPGVAFEPLAKPSRAVFHLTRGYTLTRDTETIKPDVGARLGFGPVFLRMM